MFDFSFGEMLVVGLVALVVLGPERLPKAARFVGLWVRRARAQWYSVKSELEREIASEDLRRSLADGQQVMRETEAHLRATDAEIRSSVASTMTEVRTPVASELPQTLIEDAAAEAAVAEHPVIEPPTDFTADVPKQDAHGQ
ncbi:MAG: Sec-independent protein translocase protein TatB [Thermomonas sp.]